MGRPPDWEGASGRMRNNVADSLSPTKTRRAHERPTTDISLGGGSSCVEDKRAESYPVVEGWASLE